MTTDERLVRIESKLDDLRETVASSVATHDACRQQQREHHATLYGNGKSGLKSRLEALEHFRNLVRVGICALWTVLGAAVSLAVGWVAKLF